MPIWSPLTLRSTWYQKTNWTTDLDYSSPVLWSSPDRTISYLRTKHWTRIPWFNPKFASHWVVLCLPVLIYKTAVITVHGHWSLRKKMHQQVWCVLNTPPKNTFSRHTSGSSNKPASLCDHSTPPPVSL